MPVRWSADEFALFMRHMGVNRHQIRPVTEKAFMAAVVRLAKQYRWMVYHTWSSKKSPEGFPDLILAPGPDWQQRHPGQAPILYAVELKTDTGQLTPAQAAWLSALAGCSGVVAECWRPSMLNEVVEKLRGVTK